MWSLYEDEKELKPLVFSNGKTQEDIVKDVLDAIKEGHKVIFIKGICGTGKSAIALNLARKLGKTSIVVPIKSLQEQYTKDYTDKKYVLKSPEFQIKNYPDLEKHQGLENSNLLNEKEKLKIYPIVGRKNFKCKFLEESALDLTTNYHLEKNAKLTDIFQGKKTIKKDKDSSCDNIYLPCKIEIKEKNLERIKDFIKENSSVQLSDFTSVNEIKRMTIAPVCPYWSPILPEEFSVKKFKESEKIEYTGLNNKRFIIHLRKKGCAYYEQYRAYSYADVIIFNSRKYLLETSMDRKPATELEIIDECDEFLDSFANQEKINLNRLLSSLNFLFPENNFAKKVIDELIDTANAIRIFLEKKQLSDEISEVKNTPIEELLKITLRNYDIIEEIESDEHSYLYHLDNVARTFIDFIDETFFSLEKKDNEIVINLVTTNLEKRFKDLLKKNKIFVLMSGTIHSESVLKNIFGLDKFKIIEAETANQGDLIKCKYGYELDCKYSNFQNKIISREEYLKAFSKALSSAKKPVLIQVNSFYDLPTDEENIKFSIKNLLSQEELMKLQENDPFGKRVTEFKNKKIDTLFTTKCSRGIDFPGDTCNSIIMTKFPYPDISSLFWKILKKTRPEHFNSFYMDKARREFLQRIYRGLRSKNDKIYLLSPDVRVLNFNFNNDS